MRYLRPSYTDCIEKDGTGKERKYSQHKVK
jgi:hypothetical protein